MKGASGCMSVFADGTLIIPECAAPHTNSKGHRTRTRTGAHWATRYCDNCFFELDNSPLGCRWVGNCVHIVVLSCSIIRCCFIAVLSISGHSSRRHVQQRAMMRQCPVIFASRARARARAARVIANTVPRSAVWWLTVCGGCSRGHHQLPMCSADRWQEGREHDTYYQVPR